MDVCFQRAIDCVVIQDFVMSQLKKSLRVILVHSKTNSFYMKED